MNTTSTKSNAKGAEIWVLLFICLLGVVGAFSLLNNPDDDKRWTQTETEEPGVVYDAPTVSSDAQLVLDN